MESRIVGPTESKTAGLEAGFAVDSTGWTGCVQGSPNMDTDKGEQGHQPPEQKRGSNDR